MVHDDDDKVTSCLVPDLNIESATPSLKSIELDSSISNLLNLEYGGDAPTLIPQHNPFLDEPQEADESPKVYIAPRVMINHQDSFSLDSQIDDFIEDARILSSSPRGIQDLSVPSSPRAFVHLKSSESPPESPVLIDTAAPFESVKAAVSMFGGVKAWKTNKIQTTEVIKNVYIMFIGLALFLVLEIVYDCVQRKKTLEKIQEDMSEYKKQTVIEEDARQKVIMEIERTRCVIEELKLELEKAENEEKEAKQDSELAKLRVEEMEKDIADESSVAMQIEMAKERYLSAVSELGMVREEIQIMYSEYESLLREKDLAAKNAEASALEAKEVEKQMEGLRVEVIATKELLDSAHVAHLEAQEKKLDAAMARDQDVYNQEKELRMVEDKIEWVRQEIDEAYDMKTKLVTASELQEDLRTEIAAYKDSKMGHRNKSEIQVAVDSARKELEEVKSNIEKAGSEVKTLKIIIGSLKSQLERENKDLSETKQRSKEEARDERCTNIAEKQQEAVREAEEAKLFAIAAQEEVRKAKEETDEAKRAVYAIEKQLIKAKKEMEAARASEKLALAAIKAIQETECANKIKDISSSPRSITISVEEYYELCKQAHEVEEEANQKLAEIVSKVELAKEEESRVLENLNEVSRETDIRKVELKEARGKAEEVRKEKVGMDHELRKWRSDTGYRSPEGDKKEEFELSKSKSELYKQTSFAFGDQGSSSNGVTESKKKKKKFSSLLPKVFMFLTRKKSSHK